MSMLLLFQKTQLVNEDAAEVASKSIFEVILSSGVGAVIVLILLVLSIIAVYIFVERYLSIRRYANLDASFMNNVKYNVQTGNINGARALCQSVDAPVARMLEKGISRIGQPIGDIEKAMESVGKLEVGYMEKKLGYLSLIAKLAPMFGFVGTIMGVIKIFYDISLTDNLSIGTISGGLYQKMITSAGGLMVGIIAFLGYYLLSMLIDRVVSQMEKSAMDLIDVLHAPSK